MTSLAADTVGNPAVNIGIFVLFVAVTLVAELPAAPTASSRSAMPAGNREARP